MGHFKHIAVLPSRAAPLAWVGVIVFFASTGPAALAQEVPVYDPDDLATCLSQSIVDPNRCIGVGADACFARSQGSNVAYGFCNGAERDDWDARLNATYQGLLETQATATAKLRAFREDYPDLVAEMRAMQRQWIAYRDAACEWDYLQWGGGTGGGPAPASCQMVLTAQQALFLKGWAQ